MNETDGETIVQLLKAVGARQYIAAPLPNDIERGPTGKCFDWSALQAARHRSYTYVEGFASDPENNDDWILHAWLTDGKHAFDPTWHCINNDTGKHEVVPSVYWGIPMDILDVHYFMAKTGYQGVLANRWRAPEIVDRILDKVGALV